MPSSSTPQLPSAPNTSNPYKKIDKGGRGIAKLQYPSDMGRYYIAFQFAEYSASYNSSLAPAVAATNSLTNFLGITKTTSKAPGATYGISGVNAQIALPIPNNLVDDQQLDYNSQNLLNVAGKGVQAVTSNLLKGVESGIRDAVTTAQSVAQAGATFGSVFSGETVNPFLAMMFTGPRFKTHQFGWRFSPKTEAETNALVNIINTFKAKSLPVSQLGGTFFAYPDVCLISLYPDKARDRMYRFKPAVITQTQVHYAPSGTPAFFAGSNGPAEIELKIQFSEISIWTNNDFPGYGG